jgi:2-polyprenyl-3-methyl-5-hydroxy-6-metoxy-1,4-benzoquinol methylase
MLDPGKYNKDQEEYERLCNEIYARYPDGVKLPAEYASFVHEDLGRLLFRLARYKFIVKQLKPTDKVLEIGCGSGLGTSYMAQVAEHVTGIDIKTSEIEEAQKITNKTNIDHICGDFFDYDFKNKFDVIVNLDVIEHLKGDQPGRMLKRCAELNSDKGYTIIGTPSFYSWEHQGALSKASHEKCYDLPELNELVEQYFDRTFIFSMNDELVHTGHYKMAWYYIIVACYPKG